MDDNGIKQVIICPYCEKDLEILPCKSKKTGERTNTYHAFCTNCQIRYFYSPKIFDLEQKRLERAVESRAANDYNIGKCAVCGEPLVWQLNNINHLRALEKLVNIQKIKHVGCKRQEQK